MAKLGAARFANGDAAAEEHSWDREAAKLRLLSNPRLASVEKRSKRTTIISKATGSFAALAYLLRPPLFVRVAAVLVLATLGAYQFGIKRGLERATRLQAPLVNAEANQEQQLVELRQERASLEERIAASAKAVAEQEERATQAKEELTQLHIQNASLEARTQDLSSQNQQASTSLRELDAERATLQQRLRDKETQFASLQKDLGASEDERKKALLTSASLEAQLTQLSVELRDREQSSQRQEQFLASDRDIRELMGARQLYIADVFDVDPDGNTKKPYGRVFYTRGKSLIFYAFDLDRQRGLKNATFQAWGRPSSNEAQPVSLGIFYMDNESNRRWALKFDDPKVLEEINSVFVTVEPKGGSKKPTHKPFLLAYLHTAPLNHP